MDYQSGIILKTFPQQLTHNRYNLDKVNDILVYSDFDGYYY